MKFDSKEAAQECADELNAQGGRHEVLEMDGKWIVVNRDEGQFIEAASTRDAPSEGEGTGSSVLGEMDRATPTGFTQGGESVISCEFPGAYYTTNRKYIYTTKDVGTPPTERSFEVSKIRGHQETPIGFIVTTYKRDFDKRGINPDDYPVRTPGFIVGGSHRNTTGEENISIVDAPVEFLTKNLILHGPPGTGKTYATAREAVRLCLEGAAEEETRLPGDRIELMNEYKRLSDEGRIEFMTFHQSMSYEEFVEGLRPSTDGGAAGFKLIPVDGVFKRICERVGTQSFSRPQSGMEDTRIDQSAGVFKMSLGDSRDADQAYIFEECIQEGKILLGFDPKDDLSDEIYSDADRIRDRIIDGTPNENADTSVRFTNILRNEINHGSIILVSRGNTKLRAIGIVRGEYSHEGNRQDEYVHKRTVRWIWSSESPDSDVDVGNFYPKRFSQATLYPLSESVNWTALMEETGLKEEFTEESNDYSKPHVLIIDEINRANISKVFGELITLLEPDKRLGRTNEIRLTLPYSKTRFGVPPNLHVIGTMNTADRSIALLDTALRRRFNFQELMPNPSLLGSVDGINLRKILESINHRIEYLFDREHQIGHSYFMDCHNRQDVDNAMRHRVIPLLAEYFYEDWSKVAAVLADGKNGTSGFLYSEALTAPPGLGDGEYSDKKYRWRIKKEFDYSGLEA